MPTDRQYRNAAKRIVKREVDKNHTADGTLKLFTYDQGVITRRKGRGAWVECYIWVEIEEAVRETD
jgi:hypothetical protein